VVDIRPFRGLRYSPGRISSMSNVIAPPYDQIDSNLRRELLTRDPHNVIHLVLGQDEQENRTADHYEGAARSLREWLSQGILTQDKHPAFYLCEQEFELEGACLRRLGIICALRLEELGQGGLFPHETTLSRPKRDRLSLMRACQASLTPILMVCSDSSGQMDDFIRDLLHAQPLYEVEDEVMGVARLGTMSDPVQVRELTRLLTSESLYIADGHHRYESALTYSRDVRASAGDAELRPADFTCALLVSVRNPGLRILPTHLAVRAPGAFDTDLFLSSLGREFNVAHAPVSSSEGAEMFFHEASSTGPSIGCYLGPDRFYLIRPTSATWSVRSPDCPASMRHLPVAVLHHDILPNLFGLTLYQPAHERNIRYSRHIATVSRTVEGGECHVGFFLTPPSATDVERVAFSLHRLPPKTTFFHPKIPSGLVFLPFWGPLPPLDL